MEKLLLFHVITYKVLATTITISFKLELEIRSPFLVMYQLCPSTLAIFNYWPVYGNRSHQKTFGSIHEHSVRAMERI